MPIKGEFLQIRICPFFDKELKVLKKTVVKWKKIQDATNLPKQRKSTVANSEMENGSRQKKTAFHEKTNNKNLDLKKKFNCFSQ